MLKIVEDKMIKTIEHLQNDLNRIRTGRANPAMLDPVTVSAYGSVMPLNQVAMISVPEARQLLVKPYDPSTLKDIEKAIADANLGLNPVNDGETLRITIAQLTEETRKLLVKDAKKIGENNKISIRNIRKEANDNLKKDSDLTEDEKKSLEKQVQQLTDKYNQKVDEVLSAKEKEILTI